MSMQSVKLKRNKIIKHDKLELMDTYLFTIFIIYEMKFNHFVSR
jgi:hypothetical protein